MDERLRQLERRWTETGDPADEAAYVLERVRVASLPRSRVRLAAYLGGRGARLALGDDAPAEVPSLREWVKGLAPHERADPGGLLHQLTSWSKGTEEPWAKEVLIRAGLAAVWIALPVWEVAHPEDDQQEAIFQAARAWARCPCQEHAEGVAHAAGMSALEATGLGSLAGMSGAAGMAALAGLTAAAAGPLLLGEAGQASLFGQALGGLLESVGQRGQQELAQLTEEMLNTWQQLAGVEAADDKARCVAAAVGALVAAIQWPFDRSTGGIASLVVAQAAQATSEQAVRKAITKQLAGWVLGYGDPLADRAS